jgi:hypothetical protein
MNLPMRTNLDVLHIVEPRGIISMISMGKPSVTIKREVYQPTIFLWRGKSTLNKTNNGRKEDILAQ